MLYLTREVYLESFFVGIIKMTINALICDDEINCTEEIKGYLLQYCEEHNITCFYDCVNSGDGVMGSDKIYNIAFLDIEIGEYTGMDIAEELKKRNKNIVVFFITAYEKYIDDAMNLYALRFLKKPIEPYRFYTGMDRAVELINEDVIEFFLDNNQKKIRINSKEIMYVETKGHKTKIVCSDVSYYSNELIDYWESKLTHNSFFRVHKSFILNLDYIKEYQRNEVLLLNGDLIPISYRRQALFRKYFYDYLKRRK